jgi:sugar lactone lactonase YvrE
MAQLSSAEEPTAELFLSGVPGVEALAVSPQGVLFASTASQNGRIARVLGREGLLTLAETGGNPASMAFDAAGDLLVADRKRNAILKVTPWGDVSEFAGGFAALASVDVGADGTVFASDPGASRVYRIDPQGRRVVIASNLKQPRAIAASAGGESLYVSVEASQVRRIGIGGKSRTMFAAATDGEPTAMALDESGNLYVARPTGRVSVLNPHGKELESIRVPGPRVTALAFGGIDGKTLFIAEASTSSIYRVRTEHRAQRHPWEPDKALRITEPADGAILNRHDGQVSADGLAVTVKGFCRTCETVRINGATVPVRDGRFEAPLLLRDQETKIVAEGRGKLRDAITVLWDRNSVPRYRLSTDDNIWFLRDIARNQDTYRSIFDNPYLGFWRAIHRKYGTKVHFNIYFETEDFNLSRMPDRFRPEWQANRDWIRLTFHARANDPDRPYIHASPQKVVEDYRLVTREIERFAGKELASPITTVHWGETTRAAARALRAEGVRGLAGYFEASDEAPRVSYYLNLPQFRHLMKRDYWKDPREDLLFVRHDLVINTVALDQIVPHLERVATDPHQAEVMELMIHEQYFYPDYRAYEPDFRARVERAVEWVTRRGYRPVFFEDGFLGAQ